MKVSANVCHTLPPRNTWKAEGVVSTLDPEVLAAADQVTVHLEKPGAEDALLAAGMALAKGRPLVLAAPDRKQLPWFLQQADLSYPSQITVVDTQPPDPTPPDRGPAPTATPSLYDTFIGCLMSGLSEAQYAEGRSHLMQIHQVLSQRHGSANNFCEGIKIGSTESFGSPKEALVTDMEAVRGSRRCVFYQYDDSSRPSGMWVELGAALAWGKPCVLLTPNLKGVPPSVRDRALPQLKILEYGSHEEMLKLLQSPDTFELERSTA